MELVLHHGDLLEAKADGLIITIDGSTKGLAGNVAQKFKRRWGDTWEEIESDLSFPVSLGRADYVVVREVTNEPFPFRVVFAASVLDHLNRVDRSQMPAIVRSALHEICEVAKQMKLNTLASSLLKCGWRMHASKAFDATISVVDEFSEYTARLEIHSYLKEHHDYLMGLAQSYGLLR